MLTLFPRIRPNPLPPPSQKPPTEPTSEVAPAPEHLANIAPPEAPTKSTELADSATLAEVATQADGTSTADESTAIPPASPVAAPEHQSAPDSSSPLEPASEILTLEPFVVEISAMGAAVEVEELPASTQFDPSAVQSVEPDSDSAGGPVIEDSAATVAEPNAAAPPASESTEPSASASSPAENDRPAEAAPDVATNISPEIASAHEAAPTELLISSTNVFDEMEILHEAAAAPAPEVATEPPTESPNESPNAANVSAESPQPQVSLEEVVEATRGANREEANEEPAAEPTELPPAEPFLAEQVDENAFAIPSLIHVSPIGDVAVEERNTEASPAQQAAEQESPTGATATEEASPQEPFEAVTPSIGEAVAEVPAAETSEAAANPIQPFAETIEAPAVAASTATPPASLPPRKPRRSKDSFFQLERVPEPESMDHSGEVEAYSSAVAQSHLDAIDDTFVAHAQLLLKGRERGRALDIGTGPGQILIKLGSRLTRWKFVGVDRSVAMIEKARQTLANTGEVAGRIEFLVADGNSLEFPDASFDLVVCNSVLHHLAEPRNLFSEIARVVKPGGAILLRDLCRPSRFGYGSHIRKHGKHYAGEMRRLYIASVQAAYTEEELQKMVAASPLRDVRVFRHRKTHIGFERALGNSLGHK